MQLISALRYSGNGSVAFVGAGGKTTAIFQAGRELLTSSNPQMGYATVIITTTTHFGTWQAKSADYFFQVTGSTIEKTLSDLPPGLVLLTGGAFNDRLSSLAPELLEKVKIVSQERNFPLLIEADGSQMRPLKAPAAHEPAIPDFVQQVVVVAGLDGIGKPLNSEWVHRPEEYSLLSKLRVNEIITVESLANVLMHPQGGLKRIPEPARKILLLTQADTPVLQSQANTIATMVGSSYHSVVITSLAPVNEKYLEDKRQNTLPGLNILSVKERIAGVILAAGAANRFGSQKQLLQWRGMPLVRHSALHAIQAGADPVIVVVGQLTEEIENAVSDLPLRIVINPDWKAGISTSIKAGISTLPKDVGGAILMLADQPQIPVQLLKSLVEAHQSTLNPIVAPLIDEQRGNPVLFDRDTFQAMTSLTGDIGGRALMSRFPVQWLPWHDRRLLLDIDTVDDYQRFLEQYPDGEDV